MPLSVFAGELSSPTSTGNQSYTGVGFAPAAVMFWSNRVARGATAAGLWDMRGFMSSSANGNCVCIQYPDNLATTNAIQGVHVDACVFMNVDNSTTAGLIGVKVSLDADGFTINWTTVEASARAIQYVAFGGTAITGALDQAFLTGIGSTNISVTGVGFQPKVVLFAHGVPNSTPNAFVQTAGTRNLFGAASSSSARFSNNSWMADNSAASNSGQKFFTNRCAAAVNSADGIWMDNDFVSMDADGFTIDPITAASSTSYLLYLALGGDSLRAMVGNDTQKTSTGTQAKTGIGFQPTAIILSGNNATAAETLTTDLRSTLGVAVSGGTEAVCAISDTHTADPTENGGSTASGKCIRYVSGATPSVVSEANLDSVGNDGYTLNWTTADATARLFGYIALGSADGQPYRKRVAGTPFAAHQARVW